MTQHLAHRMHDHSLDAYHAEAQRISRRARLVLEWVREHGRATDRQVVEGLGFRDMNACRPSRKSPPPRKGHPKSRPFPRPLEPDLPDYLNQLACVSLAGTLDAPVTASLPALYLAAARALIREAQRLARGS